jgi:hypothetical protein
MVSGAGAGILSLATVNELDREYFQAFWRTGFMPLRPTQAADLLWLPERFLWIFGGFGTGLGHIHGGLMYRWSPVFAAVMAYGWWSLWRTKPCTAGILTLPVAAAIGAAAAGLYPFTARLVTFLVPLLLVAVAAGAARFTWSLPHRLQFLSPAVFAILGGAPLYATVGALPPYTMQHLRPALEHLAEHRQEGDAIYVYSGAGPAFQYYSERLNLQGPKVVFGRCAISEPRRYLRELDRLRGERRAWIVMTHEQVAGERELILEYLRALGEELDAIDIRSGHRHPMERASLHLYDLGSPPPDVDADAFPLPAVMQRVSSAILKWGCYGVTGGEPQR